MSFSYADIRTIDKTGSGVPHPRGTLFDLYDEVEDEWHGPGVIVEVAGKVAARGRDHFHLTICNKDDQPIALFNKQKDHEPIVNLIKSTNHAETGRPVGAIGRGDLALFILEPEQVVVAGDNLTVADGGFVELNGDGALVAIAAEDVTTPEGVRKFILCWSLIGRFITLPLGGLGGGGGGP